MLCKCYWIVLYIVHFTAFCLGGVFRSRCSLLGEPSYCFRCLVLRKLKWWA